MARFSKETARLLHEAGWYEGREADASYVSDTVVWLQQRGYEVTDSVQDFLKEFGNLILHRADSRPAVYLDDVYTFEKDVKPIREHLGLSLCPVGNTAGSVLLVSPEGKVYDTDGGSYFDLLGRSVDEAIENLLQHRLDARERLLDIHQVGEILGLPPLPDDFPV